MKRLLVVFMEEESKEHKLTLKEVKRVIKDNNLNAEFVAREKIERCTGYDLIISVGGDGTFLRASHNILDKTPLLGVNSNPSAKEGFFTKATRHDFNQKFKRILEGNFSTLPLLRLESIIGKKIKPELSLNEIYIGYSKSYQVAHYTIRFDGVKEEQKSSGVLIGTPAGSYAWLKSAGGEELPIDSEKFQLVTREPYQGSLTKQEYTHVILNKDRKIEVTSKMERGVVVIDSMEKEYPLKKGEMISIKVSKNPLHMVHFQ